MLGQCMGRAGTLQGQWGNSAVTVRELCGDCASTVEGQCRGREEKCGDSAGRVPGQCKDSVGTVQDISETVL